MNPADAARRYVELFNAGRHAEMGELFAEDSIWRPPPPAPEVHGGPGIRAGYAEHGESLRDSNLQIEAKRYLVDGSTVAAEFLFFSPTYSIDVIDVFDVDDAGKITAMTAYARPAVPSVSS